MGRAFFILIMIDLAKTLPYEMAVASTKLLNDQFLWIKAMVNNPILHQQILNWIRNDQLIDKGEDADGDVIGFYSFATELMSGGSKQEGDHYTLKDTGELHRSFFIRVLRDSFIIDGDTAKIEDQDWFSERIVALSELSLQKFIEIYEQIAISYAREVLFKHR